MQSTIDYGYSYIYNHIYIYTTSNVQIKAIKATEGIQREKAMTPEKGSRKAQSFTGNRFRPLPRGKCQGNPEER